MLTETDLRAIEQRMADVGAALCGLSWQARELSASFADMADQMRRITFFQFGNGLTLNGTYPTYDQSIIDHAQRVRQQRDEMFAATTSRDMAAWILPDE